MRLKLNSSLPLSPHRRAQGGWTLAEMLIAVGVGMVVMAAVVTSSITLSTTMLAIANYNDLDKYSRNTLDVMGRDLRNTAVVTALATNSVTVSNSITGELINYSWANNVFTRNYTVANTTTRTLLLTNCDYLNFQGFQRNPTANFTFQTASTPSQTKLISVSWRCSRTILGIKLNTESVQTAQICVRN